MATITSPVRRRILAGAFAASLAFALLAPVAAYAAAASFSSRAPSSGAHTSATRPTISVIAHDGYGIKGTGAYTLTVDGKTVKPVVTYLVSGSWNPSHPDYSRIRLKYTPSAALAAGTHRVTLRIHDLKHKTSTTAWSFTVDGPYRATFSAPSPAKDSTITATRPTVSLTAYDKYGVKGSGKVTMTVDGAPCVPTVTYTSIYRNFRVTYAIPSALGVGTHTVRVGTTDLNGNASSYGWSFKVAEAPLLPMPTTGSSCADCHSITASSHPMTNCPACHNPSAPTRPNGEPMKSYALGERTAHSASCAASACHRGGGDFPHVLETDCAHCHDGSYEGIPGGHSLEIEAYHASTTPFCVASGCHVSSLTLEHYRRVVDGARLTCGTCHESADKDVRSAIADGSTDCTSCHHLTDHPNTTTAHTAPAILCTEGGCHAGQVTAIHAGTKSGCAACHGNPSHAASTTCTDCHAPHDHSATPANAVITINGTGYGPIACAECHESLDLVVIHTGGDACAKCHAGTDPAASATPWLGGCAQGDCHKTGTALAQHGAINGAHTLASAPGCSTANCHTGGTDVAAIHKTQGCATCHGVGRIATLVCATSGCHGGTDTHPFDNPHPAMTEGHTVGLLTTCVTSLCHASSDLAALHAPGPSCAPCHGVNGVGGTLTKGCLSNGCHTGDVTTIHSKADPKHATAPDMCITVCHTGNIANIHGSGAGCLLCHDGVRDLTELPTTACSNCHTPYNVPTIHAFAGDHHTAGDGTCVNDSCHVSDVTALHGKQGGPGCAACHGLSSLGKTATLVCGTVGCHPGAVSAQHTSADESHTIDPADATSCTGVDSGCHATDVSVIHQNGPNCFACHSAGKTPSNACATSTCHRVGGRPKTFPELHVDAQTSHTSDNPQCAISGCHPGGSDAAAIHQGTDSMCGTCHAPDATLTIVCATCHNGVIGPIPTHSSAESSHTTTTNISGTCVQTGCHVTNVATIHAAGPGCAACHAPEKTATLVCATVGCHSSSPDTEHVNGALPHSVPDGTCVSLRCHVSNVTVLHAQADNCATCHAPGLVPTATCTDCHTGTIDLASHFAKAGAGHQTGLNSCATATCHRGGDVELNHRGWCPACHATGVTPSKVCSSCHNGTHEYTPRPGTGTKKILAVPTHATAETSHTAAYGVCVNDFCHPRNVSTPHETTIKRCAACHAAGATPSTVCATCHTGNPITWTKHSSVKHVADPGTCISSTCHVADVATVHAGLAEGGCPSCHGQDKTPSRVCTDCHTEGYAVIHDDGDAPHAVTTACSTYTYCHGSLLAIHTVGDGAPGCVACHAAGKPLTITCGAVGGCHAGITNHRADTAVLHTAAPSTCVITGCHKTDVEKLHAPVPTKCAACHANPDHALSKTCTDCHTGPKVLTAHESQATTHTVAPGTTCADGGIACHVNDVSKIHVGTDAVNHCDACHKEAVTPIKVCATCHTGGYPATHPVPAAHDAVSGTSCVQSGCHNVKVAIIHAGSADHKCICHETGKTKTFDCSVAGCHPTGSTSDAHRAHVASVAPQDIVINSVNYGSHACTECHVNELQQIHGDAASCAKCHAGTDVAASADPWLLGCVQGNCHKLTTPLAQHAAVDSAHSLSVAPTCAGTDCHGGSSTPNIAALHIDRDGVVHCDACHADGKPPLTKVCATVGCHSNSDARPYSNAHPAMTAHTTNLDPAHDCLKAGCHAVSTSLVTLHGVTGGPRCVPCHGTGTGFKKLTAICNDPLCHGDASGNALETSSSILHPRFRPGTGNAHEAPVAGCTGTGCHSRNVVAIHSDTDLHGADASPPPGCGACHGAGLPDPQTLDCLTSGCHTGGSGSGGSFPPGHPEPATHAVSNTCTGGRCHLSTAGTIHGRTGCVACHSTTNLHGGPSFVCADCHPTKSFDQHFAIHSGCVGGECHDGTDINSWHYDGGPSFNLGDPNINCQMCHGSPGTPGGYAGSPWEHDNYGCYSGCHG